MQTIFERPLDKAVSNVANYAANATWVHNNYIDTPASGIWSGTAITFPASAKEICVQVGDQLMKSPPVSISSFSSLNDWASFGTCGEYIFTAQFSSGGIIKFSVAKIPAPTTYISGVRIHFYYR